MTSRTREEVDAIVSPWVGIDFKKEPHRYKIGKGEQGVLLAAPYKEILLPLWKFKTPEIATKSVADLKAKYEEFCAENDYVGMDMTRKYVQMGWSRSKRFSRHKSGKKYDGPVPDDKKGISGAHGRKELPLDPDPVKEQSAQIFKVYYDEIMCDPRYIEAKTYLKK